MLTLIGGTIGIGLGLAMARGASQAMSFPFVLPLGWVGLAVVISASIGVLLGLGAGYFAGRADWMIMALVNVMLTFPFAHAVLGPSLLNMIIGRGGADWPPRPRHLMGNTLPDWLDPT